MGIKKMKSCRPMHVSFFMNAKSVGDYYDPSRVTAVFTALMAQFLVHLFNHKIRDVIQEDVIVCDVNASGRI